MNPPAAPAATAPRVPRSAGSRVPRMTTTTATVTSAPMNASSAAGGNRRATQLPTGTVSAAATHNGTMARGRTRRHPPASPTTQMAPAAQFARTTPWVGPSSSTSAGTATSAKPIPVSHCTQDPNSTIPPSINSPVTHAPYPTTSSGTPARPSSVPESQGTAASWDTPRVHLSYFLTASRVTRGTFRSGGACGRAGAARSGRRNPAETGGSDDSGGLPMDPDGPE